MGVEKVEVTADEAGQKLVQFLMRRLGKDVPKSLIMRLIRKGQVRVDSGRKKPFDRLAAGQIVRIPPIRLEPKDTPKPPSKNLRILHDADGLLIVAKPQGLPVQPGTGHTDAVTTRLAAMFPNASFTPTPAHRLDRDTSGILLCGSSYARLRALQDAFRTHSLRKYYLAQVHGDIAPGTTFEMRDSMEKTGTPGKERVTVGSGKEAIAIAVCLHTSQGRSLLEIDLRSGRTHQIRVQLASRGMPIVGDAKYGKQKDKGPMRLHAHRVVLDAGEEFSLPPDWADA